MHLQAGALLKNGEYKIEKVLGQGGFGITYLAEQTSLGRKVALKEFFMEGLCNRDADTSNVSVGSVGSKKLVERFKQKFIKEARTIASFDNSHIISIHDVFEENGTAYYVMEYLGGKSLSAIVNEQGIMSETLAMKYIRQVADALAEVHANNLLHLDVKPANIMLNKKGEAVLIDFGISKHYDEAGNQTSSALIGTSEGYAPLEQYEAGALDSFTPATDIYALGATLFFLLTGMRPPKAGDVMNDGLPELPSEISQTVSGAITAAMQPRRKDRPQSIAEFLCLVESGKMQDESDGETVLNGNVKGASKREGENLFTHTASESSFDEVKGERRNEKSDSADAVILNESEESHSASPVILSVSEESQPANNEILRSAQNDNSANGRQNDKDGNEEVERRNEKERSAGAVISNESEKSQKNKPGKFLWLILLLLLIAVAGAWFLFGGAGNGDAPKEKELLAARRSLSSFAFSSSTAEQKAKEKKERLAAERRKNALVRDENELLCVACVDKNDKSILYFTGDEWKELSEDEKSNYPQLGVSIREDGHEFIIAASDCKGEYKFGGNDIDFEDVKNYESYDELDATFITTGYNDTRNIVKQTKGERDSEGISGAPATEAAWKYEVNDHDPLQWYLPSYSELKMINRHKKDINRFLEDYFPSFTPIAEDDYWSSTECSNKTSWGVVMSDVVAFSTGDHRYNSNRVRAVASAK